MSELMNELIRLIDESKSINEISDILKISNKQIYNLLTILKNKGMSFNRKYYSTGDIIYKKNHRYTKDNTIDIITDENSFEFDSVLISDLHFGSLYERIELLDSIYNYCICENIHNIFILGDLIDGTYGKGKKIADSMKQIEHFIKDYPFDKNIINYALLGDHDYSALLNDGCNIADSLQSYRHDIVFLGYNLGRINIKNDAIYLYHPFNVKHKLKFPDTVNGMVPSKNALILCGHSHQVLNFQINYGQKLFKVHLPTLSDLRTPTSKEMYPSFVKMNLKFNKELNTLNSATFNQIILVDDKCINASKNTIDPFYMPLIENRVENNTENFKSNKTLTKTRI